MTEKGRLYLDTLRDRPELSLREVCAVVGISGAAIQGYRKRHPDFLAEEERLRARANRLKYALPEYHAEVEADLLAGEPVEELAQDEPISVDLERWLVLYEESRDRIAACRQAAAEGFDITWGKISHAIATNRAFSRRFGEVWETMLVEVEDAGMVRKALAGSNAAAKAVLAAHRPELYGNKVAVNHHHEGSIQLTPGDAGDVADMKARELRRYLVKAARPAPQVLPVLGDVVEGEEIPS